MSVSPRDQNVLLIKDSLVIVDPYIPSFMNHCYNLGAILRCGKWLRALQLPLLQMIDSPSAKLTWGSLGMPETASRSYSMA